MNEAEARARLERMIAWEETPALSSVDVDLLLAMSQRRDEAGRAYGDAGWEPTYNLNVGAAEGWRWKAARAASMVTFSADGTSMNKGDIIANCEKMAAKYMGRRGIVVIPNSNLRHDPYGEVIGN